jgi:hypothetical protein
MDLGTLSLYGSTALWTLAIFQFLNPIHSRYDSLDRGSALLKAATYTQNNTNRINTHTHIHASSGIVTHDLSVRACEDGSCLRSRGHFDRLDLGSTGENIEKPISYM